MKEKITIEASVKSPIEKVWKHFTNPESIMAWNNPSDDWRTTRAENELQKGGKFNFRMESSDGNQGFDFTGEYDEVIPNKLIEYTMSDGRRVKIDFIEEKDEVHIIEEFEAETENSLEVQRDGWQNILNNFKKYCENS